MVLCLYALESVFLTVLVGSVLLQDDSQMPVVINMDGADQRLAERQRQLVEEQVTAAVITVKV